MTARMRKRATARSLGIVAGLAAVCAASSARADDLDCAILSDLVRQHTVTRLTGFTGQRTPALRPTRTDSDQLKSCSDTARSVSQGFSAAMAQFGMPLRWSYMDHTGFCTSQAISRCVPFPDPAAAPLTFRQINFVSVSWRGLRTSVLAHMIWDPSGNLTYFTPDSFTRSLTASGLLSRKVRPARGNF